MTQQQRDDTSKSDWFAEHGPQGRQPEIPEEGTPREPERDTTAGTPERGYERWEKSAVGNDPERDTPQYREERQPHSREFENVREAPDLDPQETE